MKVVNNNGDKTAVTDGDFSTVFKNKFTDGEPVQTENSYMGKNVSVTWQRYEDKSTGGFVVLRRSTMEMCAAVYLNSLFSTVMPRAMTAITTVRARKPM